MLLMRRSWISRWEETERERRIEKVVQELQRQEQQELVLQEWEEEEIEDLKTGLTIIKKRGTDNQRGDQRHWSLHSIKRQATETAPPAPEDKEADAAAKKAATELLATAAGTPAAATIAAATALAPGQEMEVFQETRGNETRGRLQGRRANGDVLVQIIWQETTAAATKPEGEGAERRGRQKQRQETHFHDDGSKRGTNNGTDERLSITQCNRSLADAFLLLFSCCCCSCCCCCCCCCCCSC